MRSHNGWPHPCFWEPPAAGWAQRGPKDARARLGRVTPLCFPCVCLRVCVSHTPPADEVAIIKGALDMTHKTARHCMTPIDMVFMLPTDRVLNEETLTAIMASGGWRGGGWLGAGVGWGGSLEQHGPELSAVRAPGAACKRLRCCASSRGPVTGC